MIQVARLHDEEARLVLHALSYWNLLPASPDNGLALEALRGSLTYGLAEEEILLILTSLFWLERELSERSHPESWDGTSEYPEEMAQMYLTSLRRIRDLQKVLGKMMMGFLMSKPSDLTSP